MSDNADENENKAKEENKNIEQDTNIKKEEIGQKDENAINNEQIKHDEEQKQEATNQINESQQQQQPQTQQENIQQENENVNKSQENISKNASQNALKTQQSQHSNILDSVNKEQERASQKLSTQHSQQQIAHKDEQNLSISQDILKSSHTQPAEQIVFQDMKNMIPGHTFDSLKTQMTDQKDNLEKIQQQNVRLNEQLQELNDLYEKTIGRVKESNLNDKKKIEPSEKQKELESIHVKVIRVQKMIHGLKNKTETSKNGQRIIDLENDVKQLTMKIEAGKEQVKTYTAIKTDHESATKSLSNQSDYAAKISLLKQESNKYKELLRQHAIKEAETQKESQKRQYYLVDLEGRLRETCQKIGVPASNNFTRFANKPGINDQKQIKENISGAGTQKSKRSTSQNQQLQSQALSKKNNRNKSINKKNPQEQEKINVTKEFYQELRNQIRDFKINQSKENASHAQTIELYNKKIKEAMFAKTDLLNRLREKDTESKIAIAKFNEIKRITKNTNLIDYELADKTKNPLAISTENPIARKPQIVKTLLDTKKRKTHRDLAGFTDSPDILPFDDCEVLGDSTDHKIAQITIYHDEKQHSIYGIQASYFISIDIITGLPQQIQGQCNISYQIRKEALKTTLVIEEGDQLKFISGFYTDQIEYIKMETYNGVSITVGKLTTTQDRNTKQKEFHIEMKRDDVPIMLFGGLNHKRHPQYSGELVLVCIGIECNNPFYEYNYKPSMLQDQFSRIKPKDEIEEIIMPEENSYQYRRGLFPMKVRPKQLINMGYNIRR